MKIHFFDVNQINCNGRLLRERRSWKKNTEKKKERNWQQQQQKLDETDGRMQGHTVAQAAFRWRYIVWTFAQCIRRRYVLIFGIPSNWWTRLITFNKWGAYTLGSAPFAFLFLTRKLFDSESVDRNALIDKNTKRFSFKCGELIERFRKCWPLIGCN